MVPSMIRSKPTTFPQVKVSLRNNIPTIKTRPGDMLINGYALVISNLVIAPIQNMDAIKADTNPSIINGSNNILTNIDILPRRSSGNTNLSLSIRHLIMTWPNTVKTIVPII